MSGEEEPWLDVLAALIAGAPGSLRVLASDELHIGGFTNVRLEHPVLDVRAVADAALAERALLFFLAGALVRGATLARVQVARGAHGAQLAALVRRQLRAAVARVDDENVSLLRYFDVYLRPAADVPQVAGARLVRLVAATLAEG